MHIFRSLLHLLSTHNVNEPLVLAGFPAPVVAAVAAPIEGAVQIMAGSLNIAWRSYKSHWLEMQSHAGSWLDGGNKALIRSAMGAAGPAFHLKWDLLLAVPLSELENQPQPHSTAADDGYRSEREVTAERLCALLVRGFGERCECVSFDVSPSIEGALLVGVRLNADKAYRQLEAGPAANATAASAAFRALWGAKAELRRFKDGAIIESVVWSSDTTTERKWRLALSERVTE